MLIDGHSLLQWSTNITYWLNNSLPVGYQNQSTAWILGGEGIRFNGNGYGTLNGNGDAWYTFINGSSNYPGRPHALTVTANNSTFQGIRFFRSQMWYVLYPMRYLYNCSFLGHSQSSIRRICCGIPFL
jgi:hypothetical protein